MLTPEDKDLLVKKGISEQQIAEQQERLQQCRLQNNWLALKRVSHF